MIRFCSRQTVHEDHGDCPGLPDWPAVLAARFFDEHQAAADIAAGVPAEATDANRLEYIRCIAADPRAGRALAVMYAEPWPASADLRRAS
jgi:hypothetical protein